MTNIVIVPVTTDQGGIAYHAVAGPHTSSGQTPGAALDALTAQLPEAETSTLVVVQSLRADRYFSAIQQQRLAELMHRWRLARDQQRELAPEEQIELERLMIAELEAATNRASDLADKLNQ